MIFLFLVWLITVIFNYYIFWVIRKDACGDFGELILCLIVPLIPFFNLVATAVAWDFIPQDHFLKKKINWD
jgi:hypothetical protein